MLCSLWSVTHPKSGPIPVASVDDHHGTYGSRVRGCCFSVSTVPSHSVSGWIVRPSLHLANSACLILPQASLPVGSLQFPMCFCISIKASWHWMETVKHPTPSSVEVLKSQGPVHSSAHVSPSGHLLLWNQRGLAMNLSVVQSREQRNDPTKKQSQPTLKIV